MSDAVQPKFSTRPAKWIVAISAVVLVVALIQTIVGTYLIAALSGAVGIVLLVMGLRMWQLMKRVQVTMQDDLAFRTAHDSTE